MIKLSRLLLTSVVSSVEMKFKFSSQYQYIIQQTGNEDRQLNVSAAGFNLGKTPDSHDYFSKKCRAGGGENCKSDCGSLR